MFSKFLLKFKTKDIRTKKYKVNSIIMLFCQLCSMFISFLMVPIIMKYLGVSIYGIWITLWGLIEWCNVFDIGLGHGLRNKYAEARAINDIETAKKYVSTTFFVLLFIACILFLFFFISSKIFNWSSILNAPLNLSEQLQTLVLFIGFFFCVKFVSNIINILLIADQSPAISSVMTLAGNILVLIGVFLLAEYKAPSILILGICVTFLQLLPTIIGAIILFFNRYKIFIPKLSQFSFSSIKNIFSLGGQFFIIQITAMLLFAFNNIIIAHTSGNNEVTEFNIAYKYINILYVLFLTLVTPLWSASTEAYSNNDISWIERTFSKMNKIWILMISIGIVMILSSSVVYNIWLKDEIKPNYLLLVLMLIYMSLWMRYTLYRTFMNGVGKIRLQFYVTIIESTLHLPLAILLGKYFGIYGVLTTMILWALINTIWEPMQFKKIITSTATNLWNK